MTERLREEMLRIGEAAEPARVSGDVWARGRRARRRDRLVAFTAVVAVLAVLGGVGWLVRGGSDEPGPVKGGTGDGAVPATFHEVPERFIRHTGDWMVWTDDVVEERLDIGRASTAFAVGQMGTLPVVITAEDGEYHPMDLPGWVGSSSAGWMTEGAPLALSPDGRRLAYGWWDPTAPLDSPMPAGVKVLDLETGEIRTIPLEGGNGVYVESLVWSPDSRWLVWRGTEANSWTPGSISGGRKVAGRIAPDATTSQSLEIRNTSSQVIAVSSSGEVTTFAQDGAWTAYGGRDLHLTLGADGPGLDVAGAAATSPDGGAVALATVRPGQDAWFAFDTGVRERPLDDGTGRYPEGATVQPVGWIDDDLVVAIVTPAEDVDDGGWTHQAAQLVVMTAPWVSAGDESYRIVGKFAEGALYNRTTTVAVDLMTVERPTQEFPAPDWPWSAERKWVVFGFGALAVVVLLGLGIRLVRRRRTR